jgi:hypothetical protein
MYNINNMVLIPRGGKGIPDIKGLVRSKRKNSKLKVPKPLIKKTANVLTPQYKNFLLFPKRIKTVSIKDVQISFYTYMLNDYSNRNSDIEDLMMSISGIGQQKPILVIKEDDKYIVIDGVLRYKAVSRLGIHTIDIVISDYIMENEFSLYDIIIHHQKENQEIKKSLKPSWMNNNEIKFNNIIKASVKAHRDTSLKMSA